MELGIPIGTVCTSCNLRYATMIWSEGTMAYVHGAYAYRCELCCLKEQLAHAIERAKDIPIMEARIKELEAA